MPSAPRDPYMLLHAYGAGGWADSMRPRTEAPGSGAAGRQIRLSAPAEVLEVEWERRAEALDLLEAFLARHPERHCAGYVGYDVRDAVEALPPRRAPGAGDVPVLWVGAFVERAEGDLPSGGAPPAGPGGAGSAPGTTAQLRRSRADHEAGVAAVIEAIRAGEIFQANLTQPVDARWDGGAAELFDRLCARSPAPFAAFLDAGESGFQVLSSSPEEFLLLEGERVRTRPIKGTRPRADDPVLDAALRAALLESDKDRAELAMIVDLLRNDLGKVARTGTVEVGPFPETASFAQAHHLFATVSARLRDGVGPVDVLRAAFPGGSITGAPKLRAMEVLEELETARRGVYTGAVGTFGPGRRMHLNVAIRTMVRTDDGRVRFDVGGGITARSDPADEYMECLHKAAGMLDALGCARFA